MKCSSASQRSSRAASAASAGSSEPSGSRAGRAADLLGELAGPGLHGAPVVDGGPHVAQHPQQGRARRCRRRRATSSSARSAPDGVDVPGAGRRGAVDLDGDPRLDEDVLADRAGVGLAVGDLEDVEQGAVGVAPHDDLRVDDEVDAAPGPGQLVRHGVHEERHVVGDDVDDAVRAWSSRRRPPWG